MQWFGYKPGARGHISRDIVPLPIPLLFWRKQKLHQGYTGCTAHSWTHTPAWQLAGGDSQVPDCTPLHAQQPPRERSKRRHVEQPPLKSLRSAPQGCHRDAAGNAVGMGRADLRSVALPGHSWAQRKKLLFILPFWKWPKSSNIIYQKFSIQKQLRVFPGLQSLALLCICAHPTCMHSMG